MDVDRRKVVDCSNKKEFIVIQFESNLTHPVLVILSIYKETNSSVHGQQGDIKVKHHLFIYLLCFMSSPAEAIASLTTALSPSSLSSTPIPPTTLTQLTDQLNSLLPQLLADPNNSLAKQAWEAEAIVGVLTGKRDVFERAFKLLCSHHYFNFRNAAGHSLDVSACRVIGLHLLQCIISKDIQAYYTMTARLPYNTINNANNVYVEYVKSIKVHLEEGAVKSVGEALGAVPSREYGVLAQELKGLMQGIGLTQQHVLTRRDSQQGREEKTFDGVLLMKRAIAYSRQLSQLV